VRSGVSSGSVSSRLGDTAEAYQLERLFVADRPLQVDQNHVELLNDGLAAVLGGAVVLVWLDARHDAVAEPPVRRLGPLALLVRPIGVVRLAEVLGRRRLSDLEDDPLEAVERLREGEPALEEGMSSLRTSVARKSRSRGAPCT